MEQLIFNFNKAEAIDAKSLMPESLVKERVHKHHSGSIADVIP